MKETQFLAPILLESPLMLEILEKIRDKYSIDKLDPSKDPSCQRARQDTEHGLPIERQPICDNRAEQTSEVLKTSEVLLAQHTEPESKRRIQLNMR